jgi:hypothetical protein
MPLVLRPSSVLAKSVLAKRSATGLGAYASVLETSPVATLTVTGALAGAGLGIASGWIAAKLFRGDPVRWAMESGGVTAAVMGLAGYSQGRNLASWLSGK